MNEPSAPGSVVTVTPELTARTCRPAGGGPFEPVNMPSILPVRSCARAGTCNATTSSAAAKRRISITPLTVAALQPRSKPKLKNRREVVSGYLIERVDEPAPRVGRMFVRRVDLGAAPPSPDRAAAARPHGMYGQAAEPRDIDGCQSRQRMVDRPDLQPETAVTDVDDVRLVVADARAHLHLLPRPAPDDA